MADNNTTTTDAQVTGQDGKDTSTTTTTTQNGDKDTGKETPKANPVRVFAV